MSKNMKSSIYSTPQPQRRRAPTGCNRNVVLGAFVVWTTFFALFKFEKFHGVATRTIAQSSTLDIVQETLLEDPKLPPPRTLYWTDIVLNNENDDGDENHPLFTCPDGRSGLHVIHTRFLLGQYKVNSTFIASRLLLLSTFFVPSLNAQTSQSFVVVASFDDRLPETAVHGLRAELSKLHAPVLMHKEGFKEINRQSHETMLTQQAMTTILLENGILTNDQVDNALDFYISSRFDSDDAVHVGGVHAVQNIACESPTRNKNYRLHVAYMRAGLLWKPSAVPGAIYGEIARPDPEPPYLAILQSMISSGKVMAACPLSVYSHQHMQPYVLAKRSMPDSGPECPFVFRCARNIHVWEPPQGEWGSLYVRTATSSTHDKNKTSLEAWTAAEMEIMRKSFGLDEASLLLTNMVFSGLQAEAPDVLIAKNPGKWK